MSAGLSVLIAGQPAGELRQGGSGSLLFRYHDDYRGVPLSASMPLSTSEYGDSVVTPYLWGLLPEDPDARRRIASEEGVSPNNPFALLRIIGLDCPGAVQFVEVGTDVPLAEHLVRLSGDQIALRLLEGRSGAQGWLAQNERWSLGGQQNKFALRRQGDSWFSCEGAAATTHIFKSGVADLSHQALNEFVCMRIAAKLGVNVAEVAYQEFAGEKGVEPAVIVKRYDRRTENGVVTRLHQEDLCQALSCLPSNKYTADGGPSCVDVIELLMATGSRARENVASFLRMLFFNYLLAATDAHAKNYSIMLDAGGDHALAPMYDVASIAPYVDPVKWQVKPPKLAMSIGGENRAGRVTANNLRKLVDQCGLDRLGITAEGCAMLLSFFAALIPTALSSVFDELEQTESAPSARELRAHMEEPIARLCQRSASSLG